MTLAADQLPNDVAALQAIIAKQAVELEEPKSQLKARDVPACSRSTAKVGPAMPDLRSCAPADRDIIEQLQLNLDKLKRSQFGRSSEKVQRQIDQLELALEDLQTDRAAEQAEEIDEAGKQAKGDGKQDKKKCGRKKLSAHLPRERSVLDPGETCPDCGGELRLLGEDINELLDYVSAKLKVLQPCQAEEELQAVRKDCSEAGTFDPDPARHGRRRPSEPHPGLEVR